MKGDYSCLSATDINYTWTVASTPTLCHCVFMLI